MMKTVDVLEENVENTEPEEPSKDIEKIVRAGAFGGGIYSGTALIPTLGAINGVTGAVDGALATSSDRLNCGDPVNIVTGAAAGALYGGVDGSLNGAFKGFRIPMTLLTGEPMKNALKCRDTAAAKKIMQECCDHMKNETPNVKDPKLRQQMEQTTQLIDQKLKCMKPRRESSIEDIRNGIQLILYFPEILGGVGLGSALANAGGLIGGIKEGIRTGRDRLCTGDIPSTLTGTGAGFTHGFVDAGCKNFFKGLGYPLTLT